MPGYEREQQIVITRLTESPAGVLASKDVVARPGSVHVSLPGDVEDLALDGNVNGLGTVRAIELGELSGCEGVVL